MTPAICRPETGCFPCANSVEHRARTAKVATRARRVGMLSSSHVPSLDVDSWAGQQTKSPANIAVRSLLLTMAGETHETRSTRSYIDRPQRRTRIRAGERQEQGKKQAGRQPAVGRTCGPSAAARRMPGVVRGRAPWTSAGANQLQRGGADRIPR